MAINAYRFESGATTGGAGTSGATSPAKPLRGTVLAVHLEYVGSPPGSTDVILRTKAAGKKGGVRTLLSIANANADGWFDLATPVVDAADGSTPTFNATEPLHRIGIPVDQEVELDVAQANEGDEVNAVVLIEESTP